MNEGLIKFLTAEVEKRKAIVDEKKGLEEKAAELKAEYEEVLAKADAISTDEIEKEIVELESFIRDLVGEEEKTDDIIAENVSEEQNEVVSEENI